MIAAGNQIHVASQFQPVLRELGIDAEAVFDHPAISAWRSLPDRQNCILSALLQDGRTIRWHVKRYARGRGEPPALAEVRGLRLLVEREIPTMDLVAWGGLDDGRSFVILNDLAGFSAADKLVRCEDDFSRILAPTAELAARLHDAGLHHRDLYLCHFFARVDGPQADVRLIDAARVRELPRLLPRRWVTKDLAQFWYSTVSLPISNEQRDSWLSTYAQHRGLSAVQLRGPVERKVRWIARHDQRLRRAQPLRNVSIPQST
jgi:hypothetical protein